MSAKRVVGYCDPLVALPGSDVRFKVDCDAAEYAVDIVRLRHGDESPDGPGFKETVVEAPVAGTYPGRRQALPLGSYVRVANSSALGGRAALTIGAWVYPTKLGGAVQAIFSHWLPARSPDVGGLGFALLLDETGRLTLWVGGGGTGDSETRLGLRLPVAQRVWQFVASTMDLKVGRGHLHCWAASSGWASRELVVAPGIRSSPACHALIGAAFDATGSATHHFNGKIEQPTLVGRCLSRDELTDWIAGGPPPPETIASWDFSHGIASTVAREVINGLHGQLINMPTRAVTGHNWTGNEANWNHAPDQYGAIHFHDDDLEDACWETDFTFHVPEDLRSGVYAARLRTADDEDHVPFIVRASGGGSSARIAVMLPTLTYLAYADELIAPPHQVARRSPEDEYVSENRLVSQYNWHSDRSGVAFASLLRPLLNLRPRYRYWLIDFPHGLSVDLYLLDWLEHLGLDYELITDHDLDAEGADLLRPYRTVLTGAHPEYVTQRMIEAINAYVDDGGRLMYLGGNGFCVVTAIHPERPHVSEIRREGAGPAYMWGAEPGELHLATSGEQGGFWTNRSLRPRSLIGVDFAMQTYEHGYPYNLEPGGRRPELAFIFDGVDTAKPIGDFSLILGAAAGLEIDSVDYNRGTPAECVVVASATGFSPQFYDACADMVFRPTARDGAIFGVSSMAWLGALSHNDYDNEVSRITRNVLEAFLAEGTPRWSQRESVYSLDAEKRACSDAA